MQTRGLTSKNQGKGVDMSEESGLSNFYVFGSSKSNLANGELLVPNAERKEEQQEEVKRPSDADSLDSGG